MCVQKEVQKVQSGERKEKKKTNYIWQKRKSIVPIEADNEERVSQQAAVCTAGEETQAENSIQEEICSI